MEGVSRTLRVHGVCIRPATTDSVERLGTSRYVGRDEAEWLAHTIRPASRGDECTPTDEEDPLEILLSDQTMRVPAAPYPLLSAPYPESPTQKKRYMDITRKVT